MLFLNYIFYISSFFTLIAGEDNSPVPGTSKKDLRLYGNMYGVKKKFESSDSLPQRVSNDDHLFNSPIPKLPWELKLKNQFNLYRTEIEAHPYYFLTGAAAGTGVGYGIFGLSNYALNKGQKALETVVKFDPKPSNSLSSKLFSYAKRAFEHPVTQNTIKTTSIGKKCLLGVSVVVHRKTILAKLKDRFPRAFRFLEE